MKDKIEARLKKLEGDIASGVQKLTVLRAETSETEALVFRMQGAAQVCREFLQPEGLDMAPPAEPPAELAEVRNGQPAQDHQENGR